VCDAAQRHLHAALFHADATQQRVSRRMCAVWMEGNPHAHALLLRCLPTGVSSLVPPCRSYRASAPAADASPPASRDGAPASDAEPPSAKGKGLEKTLRASPALAASLAQAPRALHEPLPAAAPGAATVTAVSGGGAGVGNVARAAALEGESAQEGARRLERSLARGAWEEFLETLLQDRSSFSARWNARTRLELRAALEQEAARLDEARANQTHELVADGPPRDFAWNHEEFAVEYASLDSELCVGGIYLQHALDALEGHKVTVDEMLATVPDVMQFVVTVYRTLLQSSALSEQDEVLVLRRARIIMLAAPVPMLAGCARAHVHAHGHTHTRI